MHGIGRFMFRAAFLEQPKHMPLCTSVFKFFLGKVRQFARKCRFPEQKKGIRTSLRPDLTFTCFLTQEPSFADLEEWDAALARNLSHSVSKNTDGYYVFNFGLVGGSDVDVTFEKVDQFRAALAKFYLVDKRLAELQVCVRVGLL